MEGWNILKSQELYGIQQWGEGYFAINQKGNVVVRPNQNGVEIDLYETIQTLNRRGIEAPVLVRFDGILKHRIEKLASAFESAIQEIGYQGRYRGVFPVKVNQQRHVVDAIKEFGNGSGLGIEVGSKPELVAMLAMYDNPDCLFLCNGYKDSDYIELALLGRKLGKRVIIIIEALVEVELVLNLAERLGIEAELGIRMKPVAKGSGHWEASGGEQAKFGLNTSEIMTMIDTLNQRKKGHWVKLLHHHIGSQITSISAIQKVLRESTRMYTELVRLCPSMCLFDVGGGLAVDYDGSRTNFSASMNYTLEEYARDVVDAIHNACQEANVPSPDIITESGRALTAHHAVFIMQVVDTAHAVEPAIHPEAPPTDHKTLETLFEMYQGVTIKNCHETFNDLQSIREDVIERFIQGDISLEERAYADRLYWQLIAKIKLLSGGLRYVPEDLEKLGDYLRDTYFCSFSVFQSLPDIWAIDQLFPVMPIHRLSEEPTRQAILADMSCDSDGKIDRFVDLKDVKDFIPLHTRENKAPYYLAVFMVGAYQEILGDLHNLFGDTHAVHLDISETGELDILHVVQGDTVREVLSYVQYDTEDLVERWRKSIEKSLKEGTLSDEDSAKLQKRYREALNSYTYFEV